jgi:prepilin-type N-terminal cleavage/methylation domain-containing protein
MDDAHSSLSHYGFTLIELLMTISIIMLLMGGGIASYLRLNNRQNLVNTGKQLELMMRAAQKKARVGDKPQGCVHLLSYEVLVLDTQLDQAQLIAECDNSTYLSDTFQFPFGVTATNGVDMHFVVLQGGVDNPGNVMVHNTIQSYGFAVDAGGQIGNGALATYP